MLFQKFIDLLDEEDLTATGYKPYGEDGYKRAPSRDSEENPQTFKIVARYSHKDVEEVAKLLRDEEIAEVRDAGQNCKH